MGTASLLLVLSTLGQLPPVGGAVLTDDYRQPPNAAPAGRYQLEPAAQPAPTGVAPTRSDATPITVPSDNAPPRYAAPSTASPVAEPAATPAPRYAAPPNYAVPENTAPNYAAPENYRPQQATPPATKSQPVEVTSAPAPTLANQLLTEALALPPGSDLTGRPLGLTDLLTLGFDRRQQTLATRAYWTLATATMRYHYRLQEHQFVDELHKNTPAGVAGEETTQLRAAQAAARARMHEAQLTAVAAQQELVSLLGWNPAEVAPLPIDVPHAGTYRTQFDLLFAGRPAPPEARKIDRTLPIRFREIEARADAVQASEDALQASWDGWSRDELPLDAVLDCLLTLQQQRDVMLGTVERYNHDIAQYALGVAPLGLSEQELSAMLIRRRGNDGLQFVPQAESSVDPGRTAGDGSVERAGFESQGWTSPRQPVDAVPVPQRARQAGEPTLAEPRLLPSDAVDGSPARAIAEFDETPADQPATQSANPLRDRSPVAPIEMPDLDTGSQPAGELQEAPRFQPGADGGGSARHEVSPEARLTAYATDSTAGDGAIDRRLYPALFELSPGKRAQRLGILLHWDRDPPDENAEPISMEACIELVPATARHDVIHAYWRAREGLARHQVAVQRCEQLDALAPWALEQRAQAGGSLAMLRLQAQRMAAEAERIASEARLYETEHELSRVLGRNLNVAWVRAINSPHSGGYEMRYEAQPPTVQQLPEVLRLVEIIPGWQVVLQDQAAAVVTADVARATLTADYEAHLRPIDDVLVAIDRQASETLAFLDSTTHYNTAIADYVLAVLPADTPQPLLLTALLLNNTSNSQPAPATTNQSTRRS